MDIKIGDKIAYIKYNTSTYQSHQEVGWGYVFYVDETKVGCCKQNCIPLYINRDSNVETIYDITKETKIRMKILIENHICELKSKIKKLTSEEKDELTKNKFESIKQKILNTAVNMILSEDESDFTNKLKEICRLKNNLYSIKISDIENVHKQNGVIKGKINSLEKLLKQIDKLEFE